MNRNALAKVEVSLLARVFNECFESTENTQLIFGANEPIYLPAGTTEPSFLTEPSKKHCIFSTRDYAASALHEVSHWCLAGVERRSMIDYGYWYEPDGRTEEQQRLFEKVEVKPQALERILARACGLDFRLSVDNVNNPDAIASETFRHAVQTQTESFLLHEMPARAKQFCRALIGCFGTDAQVLSANTYLIDDLV